MNTKGPSDSSLEFWAVVNTLGHAALVETLRMAAYYVSHSNHAFGRRWLFEIKEAESCYAYVQGSGLEVLMNKFGLNYDVDQIKDTFNYCVRRSA